MQVLEMLLWVAFIAEGARKESLGEVEADVEDISSQHFSIHFCFSFSIQQ